MRRGLIIYQSPKHAEQSLKHNTRHSKPRRHPREPKPTTEQLHHPHQKVQMHIKTNPHQPKAQQIMGGHQKLIATLLTGGDQSPHTQNPHHRQCSHPQSHPEWPQRHHHIKPGKKNSTPARRPE